MIRLSGLGSSYRLLSIFQRIAKWSFANFKLLAITISVVVSALLPVIQIHYTNSIYDISYIVTNYLRISSGQIPYRDFILVHNPGNFLVGGILFKLFGTSYIVLIVWMILMNLLTLYLLALILSKLNLSLRQKSFLLVAMSFALPYSNVAQTNYDADATIMFVICLYVLHSILLSNKGAIIHWYLYGVLSLAPFIFKQNIGIAHVASSFIVIALLRGVKSLILYLAGIASSTLVIGLLMIHLGILSNWWNSSIVFAAQSRLGNPFISFKYMLLNERFILLVCFVVSLILLLSKTAQKYIVQNMLFSLCYVLAAPAILILLWDLGKFFISIQRATSISESASAGGALLYGSMYLLFWIPWLLGSIRLSLATAMYLFGARDPQIIGTIALILPTLVMSYFALLSQGINGSTYSLGALLVLLLFPNFQKVNSIKIKGSLQSDISEKASVKNSNRTFTVTLYLFIGVFSLVYALSSLTGGRLTFADLQGKITGNPDISWMRTPGDYLNNQVIAKRIVREASKKGEVVVFIPTAEFGFWLSGKPPLADVHTFDSTTNPYLDEVDKFLSCNLVDIVVYSSKNQVGLYRNFSWKDLPPPPSKYRLVSSIGPFEVFRVNKGIKLNSKDFSCPSTALSMRIGER